MKLEINIGKLRDLIIGAKCKMRLAIVMSWSYRRVHELNRHLYLLCLKVLEKKRES